MKDSNGRFTKGHGLIDITDMRFNRLTAIKYLRYDNNNGSVWLFKCDCGKFIETHSSHVRRGATKSCGCYNRDRIRQKTAKHNFGGTKIQTAWSHIKQRCYNPNCKSYADYGGRGIKMCDEWKNSLESFGQWSLANGYEDGLTIDREDNDGDYEPSNCRWVSMTVQENNKRNNRFVMYNGEKMTLSQLARLTGMDRTTLHKRIVSYGWSAERAVTEPVGRNCRQRKN